MSTGQLVGVFYEALLLHLHQDLLPTHGADVAGQAPAGDPASAVVLTTRQLRLYAIRQQDTHSFTDHLLRW